MYIVQNLLAATSTASARVVIGPAVCYTGVSTLAESVCQNCVLGRCANFCSIIVLHLCSCAKGCHINMEQDDVD